MQLTAQLRILLAALAALSIAFTAWAQSPFAIPVNAKSGRMTVVQFPAVSIDGKDYRLAPGARIYNANHLTVTPNMLPRDAVVKFVLNKEGQIQTVWWAGPTTNQ